MSLFRLLLVIFGAVVFTFASGCSETESDIEPSGASQENTSANSSAPTSNSSTGKTPVISIAIGSGESLVFRLVSPAEYGIEYPDFYVLETEVTNAQFKIFLDATDTSKDDTDVLEIINNRDKTGAYSTSQVPLNIDDESTLWRDGNFPEGLDDHPVALVTQSDAQDFSLWLSEKHFDLGMFRLPTWNEWMITAYGKSRNYPWGKDWDPSRIHTSYGLKFDINDIDFSSAVTKTAKRTEPVKARPNGRTPEGIFGMIGNVGEYIRLDDPTNDNYFNLGSRSMGGGYSLGAMSALIMGQDRVTPRQDYWGYSHYEVRRECDLGFRLVLVPQSNEGMINHPRIFEQTRHDWMVGSQNEDSK